MNWGGHFGIAKRYRAELLSATERRELNRASLNWARLVLAHNQGQVQIQNLLFDYRKRPVSRQAVLGFVEFLDGCGRYTNRIRAGEAGWRTATLSALGEITNYCEASIAVPPIPRLAPPISASSMRKQAPDNKIARVMQEDKVVDHYMLYSQTGFRVRKPRRVKEAVNWTLSKTLIKNSFKKRQELEIIANRATVSGKWVRFFTISCKYPSNPKKTRASVNKAMWACLKLGLDYKRDDQLVLLQFDLRYRSGHWRPTVFSSGGYACFCACNHRDGFGRTIPLKGVRWGVQELVVADNGPLTLDDCEPLGSVGRNTEPLIDTSRIIADLNKRMLAR